MANSRCYTLYRKLICTVTCFQLVILRCWAVNSLPLLFMNPNDDAFDMYGRISVKATSAKLFDFLSPPPCNYTGGATVFSSFVVVHPNDKEISKEGLQYEVFVMAGRPGEPIEKYNKSDPPGPPNGVAVLRYLTTDFST